MQMITPDELVYPVLSISKDSYLRVHIRPESLKTANALALRRQYFKEMVVIDAEGRTYEVTSVLDRVPANRWWGLQFMQPRLFRVNLAMAERTPLPLSKVKARVTSAIKQDLELWDADGEVDARLSRIRSASTLREVMSSLQWNTSQ